MTIVMTEESAEQLGEYASVPIAFQVTCRYRVVAAEGGPGGLALIEERVPPYTKDYDTIAGEGPLHWEKRWNVSDWGLIAAHDGPVRVGGAAIAWRTPELTGNGDELAVLWDLRVRPERRGHGIGRALVDRAAQWAADRKCRRLMVETQNINVPACRLYAGAGFRLGAIDQFAYDPALEEVRLLWCRDL